MKTALILSGHMRCYQQVFSNTLEHIIKPYNPDIFITTWENEGWWTSPEKDPKGLGINASSPDLDLTRVAHLYNPVQFEVLQQRHFDKAINREIEQFDLVRKSKEIRPKNIVSQFLLWGIAYMNFETFVTKTGGNLINTYDLVIRMRPDLVFPDGAPTFDPNVLNFIAHTNHEGNGYGDMLAAGNQTVMSAFHWKIKNYNLYSPDRFCPHIIMKEISKDFHDTKVHTVNKYLMHTPKGQYKDA